MLKTLPDSQCKIKYPFNGVFGNFGNTIKLLYILILRELKRKRKCYILKNCYIL